MTSFRFGDFEAQVSPIRPAQAADETADQKERKRKLELMEAVG